MEKRRVLITGLGAITPLGHNADDTWQAVKDGVCGIGPITHYDCSAQKVHLAAEVKDWDPTTVLDKKDVRHMSRYIQLAMTAAKECLADSGLNREQEDLTRCGVIVSSGVGGIEMAESETLRCSEKGYDRASPFYIPTTIANMGAELGATTSVFPSDEITKDFLTAQSRPEDWIELKADDDAIYDETIEIDLSSLAPMAAMPHMPVPPMPTK